MAENSKIEWTDHTFNPWMGCTKVSPGCTHCYAETLMDDRYGKIKWGPKGPRIRTSESYWRKPIKWNENSWRFTECPNCGWRGDNSRVEYSACPTCGVTTKQSRQRVFVASLADVCELHPTILPEWRTDLAALVLSCTNIDWLFLTKRPENFNGLYLDLLGGKLPDNLWVGTSVEDQKHADIRIPELANIEARIRFLSVEPLLEKVDLKPWIRPRSFSEINDLGWRSQEEAKEVFGLIEKTIDLEGKPYTSKFIEPFVVDWVIVGGESGPEARPMHPSWARDLRDQCQEAGVAFHFKQWGEWKAADTPQEGIEYIRMSKGNMCQVKGDALLLHRIGKHNAGRLLDGREWNEYPKV